MMFSLSRYIVMAGGLLGAAVTLALLTLPLMTYCGTQVSSDSNGVPVETCTSSSLIASQGGQLELATWLYLGAMTIVSLGATALAWRTNGHPYFSARFILLLGAVLLVGVALGAFSIGMFYALPTLLVLLGALGMSMGAPKPDLSPNRP